MSLNIHLKLDGIDGESITKGFEKQIDVLNWSWGMTQSGTTHIATGSGTGKVNVSDIHFTKRVDSATPTLIKACTSGKHIASGTLTVSKADGEQSLPYFKVDLTDIIVSSYNTGASGGGDDTVHEQLSLNFRKFVMNYTPQEKSGVGGGQIPAGWDIAANVAAS